MDVRELKDKASQLFSKGKFAKAAEAYEEYCAAERKDHQSRLRCGDAWAKAGKKDKAVVAYSAAAEGFARDGFLPRAIAASKLVLELDPSHKGVQKMLADLYAQKSGGGRGKSSPSSVLAAPVEMEISRQVSAPVTSSFANRKDAIDLDAPVAKPKSAPTGARVQPETPSPMNRADALELPEYEIPMDDGPSSIGGMSAQRGPSPQRRADAIEIEVEPDQAQGPKALVQTSIEIEMTVSSGAEVEIPIEGSPLPDADQLPPELQVASQPLAPAVVQPAASFELQVDEPVPEPRPSAPTFELTEVVVEPPPPAAATPAVIASAPSDVVIAGQELTPAELAAEQAAAEKAAAEKAAAEKTAAEKAAAEKATAEKAAAEKAAAEKAAAEKAAAEKAAAEKAAAEKAAAEKVAAEKVAAEKVAAEKAADEPQLPPGLKPRRPDAVPQSSPSSSRIWLPPQFTPAPPRADASAVTASSSPPPPSPVEPASDLERSLQAFMKFDPDAAPPAAAPAASARPSFTELDLEGDTLLHAVDAAATRAEPAAEIVEEAMEAEDRPEPGALPRIPLFSDLPEDAFIALFERCPLLRFDQGQLVFEQGDKADAFYVICGGRVRVFRVMDDGRRIDLATLEEGSFFGEMALLSEAPRSASVEAADEDTQVLAISSEILTELSTAHPSVATALKKFCRQRMLSNLMNTAALFAPFNRNDRRDLIQKFRARDVKKGDVVVKEGVMSDGLYVVLSGEVEIDAGGARIATLKEGQLFGEMSLLTKSPASATVRATRHTSLLRLPKHDFDTLILSHPQVLEHVAELIDERKKADARRKGEELV